MSEKELFDQLFNASSPAKPEDPKDVLSNLLSVQLAKPVEKKKKKEEEVH